MQKNDKFMEYPHPKFVQFLLAVVIIFRLILIFGPWHPDLGNHLDWGIKFWEVGPKNFYENLIWRVSWANQPPGTIYLFAFLRKIYEVIFSLFWWINLKIPSFPSAIIPFLENKLYIALVKLPALLADFGMAYLIYRFVGELKNKKLGQIAALVFLFNPVVWYNSVVWGQTDATINFFALLAFYLLWKKKSFLGVVSFFTSLYFKGSLLILLPVFLIYFWKSEPLWWKKIVYLIVQPVIFAYLSWPFVKWMSPVPWLYHLYRDRIFGHQGNMLTANAFNLWAVFFGIDFSLNDLGRFLGLTFKNWGQLLFGVSYLCLLVKLIRGKLSIEKICWTLVLVSFSSFIFMTNMHERYLYPVFPYLTILIFLFPRALPFYLVLSVLFWFNLYHLWYVPYFFWSKPLYTPFFIKTLSIANILILVVLFFLFFGFLKKKKGIIEE